MYPTLLDGVGGAVGVDARSAWRIKNTAMVDREIATENFLEPIYLNEKMVLNCVAYIFSGYSLEAESVAKEQSDRSRSAKAGFDFLNKLINIGGEVQSKQSQATESKAFRRYTVGGLHMSLIDELRNRPGMLQALDPDDITASLADSPSYLEIPATLRPIEIYSLIDTLRIASSIVGEVLHSLAKPLYEQYKRSQIRSQEQIEQMPRQLEALQALQLPRQAQHQHNDRNRSVAKHPQRMDRPSGRTEQPEPDGVLEALGSIRNYTEPIQSVLKQVEDDYRRSRQVEMVMWSTGEKPRPFGVVDLDFGDYEPEELRAKLSGGTSRVIGKLTSNVSAGQCINLLQKSVLQSAVSLIMRVIDLQGAAGPDQSFRDKLRSLRPTIEQFGLLEVPGPAVRVAAMSVCI